MDIAAEVESVACKMEEEAADNWRCSICSILRKAKLPAPNLQKDEPASLKVLKEDRKITILPADKGNATVVMDVAQYSKNMAISSWSTWSGCSASCGSGRQSRQRMCEAGNTWICENIK